MRSIIVSQSIIEFLTLTLLCNTITKLKPASANKMLKKRLKQLKIEHSLSNNKIILLTESLSQTVYYPRDINIIGQTRL